MTSLSRSAVLAIAVAVIVLSLGVSWRQRAAIMAAGVVFIMFVGVTVKGLIGTLRNLFTTADNDSSVQARIDRVPKVLHLISEHPWFGRGFGTYNLDDYFLLDNQLQMSAIETGLDRHRRARDFHRLRLADVVANPCRWRARDAAGTALAATILGLFISSYTFEPASLLPDPHRRALPEHRPGGGDVPHHRAGASRPGVEDLPAAAGGPVASRSSAVGSSTST